MLDSIVIGWATFHRHVVSCKAFSDIDHFVWKKVWRWANKRLPNKGARCIKKRYFHREGHRDWIFGCVPKGGGTEYFNLKFACDMPIKYHIKIRMDANPFDQVWTNKSRDDDLMPSKSQTVNPVQLKSE